MRPTLAFALVAGLAAPAFAPAAVAQTAASGDCARPAGVAAAATPPEPGDATAPGNAVTGWSGGLGGSHTGTNTAGAVPESRTVQPPTARGLDLLAGPETAEC
jgi:hypothetical protein